MMGLIKWCNAICHLLLHTKNSFYSVPAGLCSLYSVHQIQCVS
uniref:Uncharacterized protein n=1 Tax=Anguilla anguilla TaxID=7936 RepID=A0A0E9TUL6_ANGAN